jgi:thiol-disulfide isomerase/thioredoxin
MHARSALRRAAFFAAALTLAAGAHAAPVDGPPRVTTRLTAPLPLPYDESADAPAQLAAAIDRAKAGGKFVLLDFGGNWCPDCRIVAGTLALDDVKPVLDRTFEVVMIDVGRLNKNLGLAAGYGVKLSAVPTIIILDSQGHVMNSGNPSALSDARTMSTQAIVDTIFGWIKPAG